MRVFPHAHVHKYMHVTNRREDDMTYAAHDPCTTSTFGHHVAGAAPALPGMVTTTIFHVEPVAGAGAVAECVLGVDGDVLVLAVQGVGYEGVVVLQQTPTKLVTGAGQIVEGVEVERRGDRHDDTGELVSVLLPFRTPFLSRCGAAVSNAGLEEPVLGGVCREGGGETWFNGGRLCLRITSESLCHSTLVEVLESRLRLMRGRRINARHGGSIAI